VHPCAVFIAKFLWVLLRRLAIGVSSIDVWSPSLSYASPRAQIDHQAATHATHAAESANATTVPAPTESANATTLSHLARHGNGKSEARRAPGVHDRLFAIAANTLRAPCARSGSISPCPLRIRVAATAAAVSTRSVCVATSAAVVVSKPAVDVNAADDRRHFRSHGGEC